MLQIENEYESPIVSNYYQDNYDHFQNPDNTQKVTDYTEQEPKGGSSTNNIYQNTTNKVQLIKEKNVSTVPFLLETSKSKKRSISQI